MKCSEAVQEVVSGRAKYACHDAVVDDKRHFLWIRRGHLVHNLGADWGSADLDDWWDAGIPVELWDSDGWETSRTLALAEELGMENRALCRSCMFLNAEAYPESICLRDGHPTGGEPCPLYIRKGSRCGKCAFLCERTVPGTYNAEYSCCRVPYMMFRIHDLDAVCVHFEDRWGTDGW